MLSKLKVKKMIMIEIRHNQPLCWLNVFYTPHVYPPMCMSICKDNRQGISLKNVTR